MEPPWLMNEIVWFVVCCPSVESVVLGPQSAARDDALSRKACPSGMTLRKCACNVQKCDGSYTDGNNINCYAVAAGGTQGVKVTIKQFCTSIKNLGFLVLLLVV